ncbi:MAG: hypothetical protein NVV74_25635 [Magnetospirillum sp.]|nr:hypothetical protein [Magnetospirillum sp.]
MGLNYTTQAAGSSSLRVDVCIALAGSNNGTQLIAALFWEQSNTALGAVIQNQVNIINCIHMIHFTSWVSQSHGAGYVHTFSVRAGPSHLFGGTVTFNGAGGSRLLGGLMASSITVTEYQ